MNKALTQLMRDVYWDEPEFIIVDMPPGTGDVALTVAQMIPKAEALVVTTPQADARGLPSRPARWPCRRI